MNNSIQESVIEQKNYHQTQQALRLDQQKEGEDEDEDADRLSIASAVSKSSVDSQRMISKECKPPLTIKQSYNNTCSAKTNTISPSNDFPSTKKNKAASNKENQHCRPIANITKYKPHLHQSQ